MKLDSPYYSKAIISFMASLLLLSSDIVFAQETSQISTSSLFIHIGSSTARFSPEQIEKIANNYRILDIAKFHAQWNSAEQRKDVEGIKKINKNIKINVYYSSSLMFWMKRSADSDSRFKNYYERDRADFKDDWLLRDTAGNIIYLDDANTAFADLSNAAYREWAIGVISHWKRQASYDGVFFDNSRPLGDYGKKASTPIVSGWNINWNVLIGTQSVNDYNLGFNQLFADSKRSLGSIIYNGIARRNYTSSRNTDLLEYSDGAMSEGFCLGRTGATDLVPGTTYTLWTPAEMLNDIDIMVSSSAAPHNKTILQKVNHSGRTAYYNGGNDVVADNKQIKRYCFGSFLLGHRPGYTFFKYGPDYGPRELDSDPKETALDLGSPIDMKYARVASDAYQREFENGMVYVNLSNDAAAIISAPYPMTLMNGAAEGTQYDAGTSVSVPPKDAFFFHWSHSALFLKNGSMGAWTSNAPFNGFVNDSLFGWQVFKSTDFIAYGESYPAELANSTRPVIINFNRPEDITEIGLNLRVEAIQNEMDLLLANPAYKRKIRGINWDWENDTGVSISPELAAATLKKVYDYGHRRGLTFGIAVQPGDVSLARAGIADLTKVKDFADFFMPMEYAQWFGGAACDKDAHGNFLTETECLNQRKIRINKDLTKFSALKTDGVAVVVAANIQTLNPPIEKLSPCQMYDLYKNILYSASTPTADGFVLWKPRELDKDYLTVFNSIKDNNPNKSAVCPLPTVSLTAPAAGALVSGSAVAVSAEAADDIGVAGVRFKLDGADFGSEDKVAPYGVNWNTRAAADGAHVLTAVARDGAGNTSTSTAVSVTVDNAPPAISVVAAAEISSGAATIGWITGEASNSRVEYGTSTAYGT
ncbi:MAG: Ig-like domain-containing protein, partial [Thermodesulfobacteriota bacterium]